MDYSFHLLFLFTAFWTIMSCCCSEKTSIPSHLLDCYRQPRPLLLPMTVSTLVEIIRKINFNSYTPISIAQQSVDILNWFSVDGLERDPNIALRQPDVIPYHRTGFQAFKQDLLFEKLIPLKKRAFDAFSLTLSEKCTLHSMLSATVDPWERGDEIQVCPNSHSVFRESESKQDQARLSSCPLERGAVLTSSGSVSVGRVISGVAASLSPQSVALADLLETTYLWPHSVDNIWAATLAGDLAEVAVLQAPQYNMDVNIGLAGRWNDTNIPSLLYFSNVPLSIIEKRSWQSTDTEILGGIDGLLLGRVAATWQLQMPEMRLSQLLDMYYLDTRLSDNYHVCRRESSFQNLIRGEKQTLVEQTQNFATLLKTKTTSYDADNALVTNRCAKTVEKFLRYYYDLFGVENCPTSTSLTPRLNLVLILDATWPPYTAQQFIVSLAQESDISFYGGSVAIINGDSSNVRVNYTSSVISIYQQITNSSLSGEDPRGLVLPKSLLALKHIIEAENNKEKDLNHPRTAKQDVVLLLGYSSTINNKDLEISKDILGIIKSQNPGMRFVYWTSHVNAPRFVPLTAVPRSHSDIIVASDNSRLELVLSKLSQTMYSARNLKPAFCKNDTHQWPESQYEEYISPGHTSSYWIHPGYLCNSLDIVKTTFENYEYGELYVCMSREENEVGDCKRVKEREKVTHALLRPCERQGARPQLWDPGCRPIYFSVSVKKTYNKCTEYACRYQDQVKFNIIVQDLHCVNLNTAVCSGSYLFVHSFCFILTLLLYIVEM